jgi:hypothetical protein
LHLCTWNHRQLAVGLILNTLGIGSFCWLIFALATYALPFFLSRSVLASWLIMAAPARLVRHSPALRARGVTLVVGQIAFAIARPPVLRADIAAAFGIPATVAGYHVVLVVSQVAIPSPAWRQVLACGMACARLTALGEPRPLQKGAENTHQPALGSRARETIFRHPRRRTRSHKLARWTKYCRA